MAIRPRGITECIQGLVEFFLTQCEEAETLEEIHRHAVPDRGMLRRCDALFRKIRQKALEAEKKGEARVDRIEVRHAEDGGAENHSPVGAEAADQPPLNEAPEEDLLAETGRDAQGRDDQQK